MEKIRPDFIPNPRGEIDRGHVGFLARETEPGMWDPLVVTPYRPELGEDLNDPALEVGLIDGFHRLEAAKLIAAGGVSADEGESETTRIIREEGALRCEVAPDLGYEMAIGLNARNDSLPYTNAAKRSAARMLKRDHPDFSNRQIGKLVGAAHTTVARWLARTDDEPGPSTDADGDGEGVRNSWGGMREPKALRKLGKLARQIKDDTVKRGWIREKTFEKATPQERAAYVADLIEGDRDPEELAEAFGGLARALQGGVSEYHAR